MVASLLGDITTRGALTLPPSIRLAGKKSHFSLLYLNKDAYEAGQRSKHFIDINSFDS